MAEACFTRARKIVEAGIGSALDRAERLTGDGMLRQSIRDIDAIADEIERRRDEQRERVRSAEALAAAAEARAATLRDQARFALSKGRDDLAEQAVMQQIAAETSAARIREESNAARIDADRLTKTLADTRERQRLLERAYRHEREKVAAVDRPQDVDLRIRRAETSFARHAARVANAGEAIEAIEQLERDETVQARLTALRATMNRPVPAAAKPKRKAR